MKAFKGFNKDMTCRGFQFVEGETYHEDKAELCKSGFHACENPLDCFKYYAPGSSVYHEVELDDVSGERGNDTKVAGKTIKIGAALDITGIIKAHFNYVKAHTTSTEQGEDFTSVQGGNRSSVQGGYCSSVQGGNGSSVQGGYGSSVQGGYGSSVQGGEYSSVQGGYGSSVQGGNRSSVQGGYGSSVQGGYCSVVMTTNGKAKAGKGSLIVIALRDDNCRIIDYCAGIVDGEKLKADTWYTVKDGKFVEV